MKNSKIRLGLMIIAIGVAIISFKIFYRPPADNTKSQSIHREERITNEPSRAAVQSSAERSPIKSDAPSVNPAETTNPDTHQSVPSQAANPVPSPPPTKDREIQDPLARVALSFVGSDPIAEQYWLEAINGPGSPAHERKDLIEDLNEDGLSDPHHPTADDLPLIVNRLEMILAIAPGAMDRVNADAFTEAYKDLVNMYNQLAQQ